TQFMALKVFDLQCEAGHVFEGWFGSEGSFESQKSAGQLACPVCDSTAIEKKLTAQIISRGISGNNAEAATDAQPSANTDNLHELQARLLSKMREVIKNSEDVGPRFADEARRIHEGEAQERAIRGTATPEERRELLDDGIEVEVI